MSVTGQLPHGDSWTQNNWLECTIVQNFLSEKFRSLIHIPISEGQITNKVFFYMRNLWASREAWRESKGLTDHCPIALCYTGDYIQSSETRCFHIALWYLRVRNNTLKEEWERDHEFEWVRRWSRSWRVSGWGWSKYILWNSQRTKNGK